MVFMKVLIIGMGSRGDVNPFLAVALKLMEKGHEVVFCSTENFRQLIEGQGLRFISTFSQKHYEEVTSNPDLWHSLKALPTLMKSGMLPALRIIYPIIMQERTKDFVVVSTPFALAAKLAEETAGIKLVQLHLAPCIFRTLQDTSHLGPIPMSDRFPTWYKKLMWWIIDTIIIDPNIKKGLNTFRRELGLKPVSRILNQWLFSNCLNMAVFSRYIAQQQPDWPVPSELFDFLLYDGNEQVPPEAEHFLSHGEPPIVFTFGTAFYFGKNIFLESMKALQRINVRGIFLTLKRENLPQELPDTIRSFPFLPLGRILPSCRAIVHHGGIGTLGQALKSGIPQLIRPLAFDQFDNAHRITTRKLGSYIRARQYSAGCLSQKLLAMLNDEEIIKNCRDASRNIDSDSILQQLVFRIEEIGNER
jgi:rhamnosyltransferase subunit B